MKFSEFHRFVQRNGWVWVRQRGSHVTYQKDGKNITVPNHGAKEMGEGLRLKLLKEMDLK